MSGERAIERAIATFDLYDHFDDSDLDTIEVRMLHRDGGWEKIIGIPLAGIPMYEKDRYYLPVFKVMLSGQSAQSDDSEDTKPEE